MSLHLNSMTFWLSVQVAANPFTSQLLDGAEMLRGVSPALVRQLMPLMDQLTPIYLDVAQGRVEFHPEPQETRALVRSYYGEPAGLHCERISEGQPGQTSRPLLS